MPSEDPLSARAARPRRKRRPAPAAAGARALKSARELPAALDACRLCPLWKPATQGVPGEGHTPAQVMLVGEAPGDSEDLQGKPFVGPAGAVLDRALHAAALDRRTLYVTNAVKHFKFEPRGKRRLHVKPNAAEIEACHWWLAQELRLVKPTLVIAMGATAARALLGRPVTISKMRGTVIALESGTHLWVTVHPSMLLRIPDPAGRRAGFARFVAELRQAAAWLARHNRRDQPPGERPSRPTSSP